MPDPASPTPLTPDRDLALRDEARTALRRWLAAEPTDILSTIDTIGRQPVAAAAEASRRLDRSAAPDAVGASALRALQDLADRLAAPPPPPRRWWSPAPPPPAPAEPQLDTLLAALDTARDATTRAQITLDTDRGRLRLADTALSDAVHLIRACARALDAAAREIAIDRPDRAAFLRTEATARLLTRERDVLTQLAVTRQGILTLDLVADNQAVLMQALENARQTSIAALRTALAARRAVTESQAPSHVAAAVEQVRRALAAVT